MWMASMVKKPQEWPSFCCGVSGVTADGPFHHGNNPGTGTASDRCMASRRERRRPLLLAFATAAMASSAPNPSGFREAFLVCTLHREV
jgi:hypothetical protein